MPTITMLWVLLMNGTFPMSVHLDQVSCEQTIKQEQQDRANFRLDPVKFTCEKFVHIGWQ